MPDVSMKPEERPGPNGAGPQVFEVPSFDRLSYYYGQMLTPEQLQRAQASIYEHLKLHNRALHGWGSVCGLEVVPHHHGHRVHVGPGMAIDPLGNELVVRMLLEVDVLQAMSKEERFSLEAERNTPRHLYLSVFHRTTGIDPSIPMTQDACGMPAESQFAMWRDGTCARVTLHDPSPAETCGFSCRPMHADAVVLARLECRFVDGALKVEHIDNSVRRPLSPYVPTVITGVSWRHGHSYDHHEVDHLLWKEGVKVRFSKPVHAHSLTPGVFDVLLHGRSSQVRALTGEFHELSTPMVREFTFKLKNEEHLDPGDRVVFALRGDFVLDECCQPVDANHVGGRVPWLGSRPGHPQHEGSDAETGEHEADDFCATPPGRFGRWTSGNGVPGGTFESWIFVSRHERPHPPKEDDQ